VVGSIIRLGSVISWHLRYAFTGQVVNPFQLVAGQNPDTFIKSHVGADHLDA
jgi:hypothetical protein